MEIGRGIDSDQLSDAFSFSRKKLNALHGLKGILSGMVADRKLNEKEFLFLDAWLKSQQFLAEDADVVGLLGRVGDILEDGHISGDELEQMEAHIESVVSHKETGDSDKVAKVKELTGYLTGIAADGVLNDREITALSAWLDSNALIRDVWPANVIVDRLFAILEDGIITDEEREDLLTTVYRVTGAELEETGIGMEESTEVWEDQVEALTISGSCFCLTGDFVSGNRSSVDTLLCCQGATTSTSVNSHVDYLVIGTLASRNWLYTSHGRKIEKALLLRREGAPIKIITERTLLRQIRTN